MFGFPLIVLSQFLSELTSCNSLLLSYTSQWYGKELLTCLLLNFNMLLVWQAILPLYSKANHSLFSSSNVQPQRSLSAPNCGMTQWSVQPLRDLPSFDILIWWALVWWTFVICLYNWAALGFYRRESHSYGEPAKGKLQNDHNTRLQNHKFSFLTSTPKVSDLGQL